MWGSSSPTNTSMCGIIFTENELETGRRTSIQLLSPSHSERYTHSGVGQEKKADGFGISAPGRGLRGKVRAHRWTPTLGSEQVKAQTGLPSPGVPSLLAGWRTTRTDREPGEA